MYNSQSVAKRIKELAKTCNISVKQLLENVGLGFNTMSNMKTSMPKADNLAKIADHLNCSVDYLLGRTDEPSRTGKSLNNLSANELTIIELFGSLSDTQQGELIGRAKMMVEQNESVFRQEETG